MARNIPILFAAILSISLQAQRVLPIGSGLGSGLGAYDMLVHDDQLIIGGLYATFNDHARRNLQGWDGTQHFDLPGAFDSASERVRALEFFEGDLIAAGRENDLANIARWDGSDWSAMGAGATQTVQALVVFGDELYMAGGDSSVSRWDGMDWQPLGERFNAVVNALEVHENVLYVSGAFDQNASNTTSLRRLARWTGSAWEEVGGGLNGTATDLLSTPDGLVVTGQFNARGDGVLVLPGWTIFDGNAFAEPSVAVPNSATVEAVCAHPEGGYLLGGPGGSLWVQADRRDPIRFGNIRSCANFGGMLLVAGGSTMESYAQVNFIGKLAPGLDEAQVDIGNISASVTPTSDHFNREPSAGFEAPQGDSTHTIYSVSPWVTGVLDGTLHSSAPRYGFPESTGTPSCGPHATAMDADYFERYYQVWKLDRSTILDHVEHWADVDYVMPHAIASWPGNGNVANGEPARLAPFADLDNNGLYEPAAGEYPLIRGDQAVYQILHSVEDTDWPNPPMTLDLHVMHHAYDEPGNTDLQNTVFTNYRIVNRGTQGYADVRMGAFADLDIGGSSDDLAGCDSLLSLFFGYNWDDFDDDAFGGQGYGDRPPAQGVLFLNEPMTAHRVEVGPLPMPISLADLMNGTQNGQPFTELGYPTHFQFPGGSFVDMMGGSSRTSVGTTGPFILPAGDTLCLDLAFPFARATSGGALASVEALRQRATGLRSWYSGLGLECIAAPDLGVGAAAIASNAGIALFPNPANEQVTLVRGRSVGTAQVAVYNAQGACVQRATWQPGVSSMTLGLNGLRSGNYSVNVLTDEGMWTDRLVVQP